ncbi:hypothetical protein, partial [Soonwooa sp.]|uniref:hypothetical protein n=1 Tax=Soonwooa sp. TaxID=1938592 RepID=UPI0028AD80A2
KFFRITFQLTQLVRYYLLKGITSSLDTISLISELSNPVMLILSKSASFGSSWWTPQYFLDSTNSCRLSRFLIFFLDGAFCFRIAQFSFILVDVGVTYLRHH